MWRRSLAFWAPWVLAGVASLLLHELFFLGIEWRRWQRMSELPALAGSSVEITLSAASDTSDGRQAGPPTLDGGAADVPVDILLQRELEQAAALSSAEQLAGVEARLTQIERIAPADMRAITQLIESAGPRIADRAFEPTPDADGPFDPESGLLYDIRQVERDGQVTYEWILVDAAGRTSTFELSPLEMSTHDLAIYKLFELARGQPVLRSLVDTARKMAEARITADEQQPAGGGVE